VIIARFRPGWTLVTHLAILALGAYVLWRQASACLSGDSGKIALSIFYAAALLVLGASGLKYTIYVIGSVVLNDAVALYTSGEYLIFCHPRYFRAPLSELHEVAPARSVPSLTAGCLLLVSSSFPTRYVHTLYLRETGRDVRERLNALRPQ